MTDPMELVGRLENIATGSFPYVASAAAEAAACIRELVEWRPIETAPRDGTVLLLRTGHGHCIVGFWLNGSWDDGDFAAFDSEDVKFWLPLPPVPGAEA